MWDGSNSPGCWTAFPALAYWLTAVGVAYELIGNGADWWLACLAGFMWPTTLIHVIVDNLNWILTK